jgi:hypothetical protein
LPKEPDSKIIHHSKSNSINQSINQSIMTPSVADSKHFDEHAKHVTNSPSPQGSCLVIAVGIRKRPKTFLEAQQLLRFIKILADHHVTHHPIHPSHDVE